MRAVGRLIANLGTRLPCLRPSGASAEPDDVVEVAGVARSAAEFIAQSGAPGLRLRRAALGPELEIPLLRDQAEADLLGKLRSGSPFPFGGWALALLPDSGRLQRDCGPRALAGRHRRAVRCGRARASTSSTPMEQDSGYAPRVKRHLKRRKSRDLARSRSWPAKCRVSGPPRGAEPDAVWQLASPSGTLRNGTTLGRCTPASFHPSIFSRTRRRTSPLSIDDPNGRSRLPGAHEQSGLRLAGPSIRRDSSSTSSSSRVCGFPTWTTIRSPPSPRLRLGSPALTSDSLTSRPRQALRSGSSRMTSARRFEPRSTRVVARAWGLTPDELELVFEDFTEDAVPLCLSRDGAPAPRRVGCAAWIRGRICSTTEAPTRATVRRSRT